MSAGEPIGVISLGSNDVQLLVAASDGTSSFDLCARQSIPAELVATLRSGILPLSALSQALQALDTLVTGARATGAQTVIALGTEVLREAGNGAALMDLAASTFSIQAVVITGQEEASLDYIWAAFPTAPATPLLVVDSGGGSTQVVVGEGSTPSFATLLDVGAVTMTRRFLAHDPPKSSEVRALQASLSSSMEALSLDITPRMALFMGGSADALVKLATHPKRLRLTREALDQALSLLQRNSAAEVAHKFKIPAERARLLPAGAVILERVLATYGLDEAHVKAHGIRGGAIVSYARDADRWREQLPVFPANHLAALPAPAATR